MGLRINTNIASQSAQKNLKSITERLVGNFARLSSGLRINSAADDAAGLGVSERMRAQVRSLAVAERNAQDGISLAQTAESALSEVSNNLIRMRELAVQASNGTLNSSDRAAIDAELQELVEEIDRIADTTEFNDINLLDGSASSVTVQVGLEDGETLTLDLDDVTESTLGLGSVSLATASGASSALSAIDAAIDSVNTARGTFGAQQNRLQSAVRSIGSTQEQLAAAESRIRDVDVAFETADLTRNSILQQAAVAVLSQANVSPNLALSLLS